MPSFYELGGVIRQNETYVLVLRARDDGRYGRAEDGQYRLDEDYAHDIYWGNEMAHMADALRAYR